MVERLGFVDCRAREVNFCPSILEGCVLSPFHTGVREGVGEYRVSSIALGSLKGPRCFYLSETHPLYIQVHKIGQRGKVETESPFVSVLYDWSTAAVAETTTMLFPSRSLDKFGRRELQQSLGYAKANITAHKALFRRPMEGVHRPETAPRPSSRRRRPRRSSRLRVFSNLILRESHKFTENNLSSPDRAREALPP